MKLLSPKGSDSQKPKERHGAKWKARKPESWSSQKSYSELAFLEKGSWAAQLIDE